MKLTLAVLPTSLTKFFALWFCMGMISSYKLQADDTQSDFEYTFFSKLEYLEDKTSSLTIDEVSSIQYDEKFEPAHSDYLNFGFTHSVYWIKLEIPPTQTVEDYILELEYPLIDYIHFYSQNEYGNWIERKAGDRYAFSIREIAFKKFTFRLNAHQTKAKIYFLRFHTEGSMDIQMKFWSLNEFVEYSLREQIAFGIAFGMMLMLFIYAVMVAYYIKKSIYWHFLFCIVCSIFFVSVIEGYAFQYLYPNSPNFHNHSLPLVACLLTFSLLHFIRQFFQTAIHLPVINKILLGLMIASVLIGLITFTDNYFIMSKLAIFNGIIAALLAFYTTVIYRARGNEWARFAVSGSYIYLIGVFLSSLESFGIIEASFVTLHGFELGTLVQLVFYSLAMNDRFSSSQNQID